MHQTDPREYYNLIRDLKSGSFDKKCPSDTSLIEPDVWLKHFSDLLGKTINKSSKDQMMENYINLNWEKLFK